MDMEFKYANEQNALMLVALLKKHGIKRVVASPGTTDICIIVDMMHDGAFEMYSCIDERSAAYMACGLAAETGEPVVIMCTEATASRDYLPGLTEAYHRKLPILAITGMHSYSDIGHLEPQVIDRSISPCDTVKAKINLPVIRDENDVWESMSKINYAILELKRRGGGYPVHVNLPWPSVSYNFSITDLPNVTVIKRLYADDMFPVIPEGKILILNGKDVQWDIETIKKADEFCGRYNAVVMSENFNSYNGEYCVNSGSILLASSATSILRDISLCILLGECEGDASFTGLYNSAREIWKVTQDGEFKCGIRNLTNVFEMTNDEFFMKYCSQSASVSSNTQKSFLEECQNCCLEMEERMPMFPFSTYDVLKRLTSSIADSSYVILSKKTSIDAWNLINMHQAPITALLCGSEGVVPFAIAVAISHPQKIVYCVVDNIADIQALCENKNQDNLRFLLLDYEDGSVLKVAGSMMEQYSVNFQTCSTVDNVDEIFNWSKSRKSKSLEVMGIIIDKKADEAVTEFSVSESNQLTQNDEVVENCTSNVSGKGKFDLRKLFGRKQ